MKRFLLCSIILVLSVFIISSSAKAKENKVRDLKDGWYNQPWPKSKVIYVVDTKAQLCFAYYAGGRGAGVTLISCEKLKRRDTWKKIITW